MIPAIGRTITTGDEMETVPRGSPTSPVGVNALAEARSLAGNLDSPQAGVFLTSIIDGIVGVATYYMHHHAI